MRINKDLLVGDTGVTLDDLTKDKYSTSEVNTGKKWIDGKPIYRKVITYTNVRLDKDVQLTAIIASNASTITIIKFDFYYCDTDAKAFRQFPLSSGDNINFLQAKWENNKILFNGNDVWNPTSYRTYTAIIEYTKTTD